ncbi:unnamed protein product [Callosobruchus maculatus]|uniref:Uncharacterized protein n=1 Tax=Callosobruchus maculatus TaxID=64391 RepID=A0A653CV68_CALMS|nr:unnamed protein product [Callosobruchus maculatus]
MSPTPTASADSSPYHQVASSYGYAGTVITPQPFEISVATKAQKSKRNTPAQPTKVWRLTWKSTCQVVGEAVLGSVMPRLPHRAAWLSISTPPRALARTSAVIATSKASNIHYRIAQN